MCPHRPEHEDGVSDAESPAGAGGGGATDADSAAVSVDSASLRGDRLVTEYWTLERQRAARPREIRLDDAGDRDEALPSGR